MKNSNRLMLLGGVVGLMLTAIPPLFADMGMWPDADANKDGSIDRTEFDAERAVHFKKIDSNGDGFVAADEMKAVHDQHRAKMEARRGEMSAKFLKRIDTSGDGKVTAAEWQADSLKRFVELDGNGDGAVTADELQKMHMRPDRKLGFMHDGKPGDMAEGGGMPHGGFKGGLARFDTDKDGKVSEAEWDAMGDKMFARLDDNNDGKISAEEMPHHRMGGQPRDGEPPVLP